MKVKELVKILSKLDQEKDIVYFDKEVGFDNITKVEDEKDYIGRHHIKVEEDFEYGYIII